MPQPNPIHPALIVVPVLVGLGAIIYFATREDDVPAKKTSGGGLGAGIPIPPRPMPPKPKPPRAATPRPAESEEDDDPPDEEVEEEVEEQPSQPGLTNEEIYAKLVQRADSKAASALKVKQEKVSKRLVYATDLRHNSNGEPYVIRIYSHNSGNVISGWYTGMLAGWEKRHTWKKKLHRGSSKKRRNLKICLGVGMVAIPGACAPLYRKLRKSALDLGPIRGKLTDLSESESLGTPDVPRLNR